MLLPFPVADAIKKILKDSFQRHTDGSKVADNLFEKNSRLNMSAMQPYDKVSLVQP